MTDWLLALVPQYGLWLLGVTTFLSCLALPVPSSILMITAGGFVAAGDLALWSTAAAAFGGAVAGDQAGYGIGRRGGSALLHQIGSDPKRGKLIGKAIGVLERRADVGIFLTRWLFAPLGPYANFTGGAIRYDWLRFTIAGVLGEVVWVGLYVGMGYVFAGNIEAANDMLGSALGFVTAGAVMVGLGMWLRSMLRRPPRT